MNNQESIGKVNCERCKICKFFSFRNPEEQMVLKTKEFQFLGHCRRHSPVLKEFPRVWEGEWCGDFIKQG